MAQIIPLIGERSYQAASDGTLTASREYFVTDLAPGETPDTVPGVPRRGSTIVINSVTLVCTSVDVEQENDNTARVTAGYTSRPSFTIAAPDQPEWSITTQTETVDYPRFVSVLRTGTNEVGGEFPWIEWEAEEPNPPVLVTFTVLTATVEQRMQPDVQSAATRQLIDSVQSQIGHIHRFALAGNVPRLWLLADAQITSSEPGIVTITYRWLHDPGTPQIFVPNGTPTDGPGAVAIAPARGSFEAWYVRNQDNISTPPIIQSFPVIPRDGSDPRWDPDGWVSLPGSPL